MSFSMGPALLFCPADRPDRYEKAAARADAVILDLEDAVAPADKPAARDAVLRHPLDPDRTIVRVNGGSSGAFEADLELLAQTAYRTVMLAKAESVEQVAWLSEYAVIAMCETARGVLAAPELAAVHNTVGLAWGAEDLVATAGGTSSRRADGRYRDVARHARSTVLLAAAAHGRAAIDAVYVDLADLGGLAAEAEDAAASGFAASACIHPSQVPVIRQAYRPAAHEVEWARAVLVAAEGEPGAFRFRDAMVDAPVLAHANRILARADAPQ
ncbi:HpcH/HpaI aldolase/citrate lyase family protein [Ruicaihuangia caeni]|uniref:CoA ester lyase n=1 Tax=Ruicaihuangia caeni TaxID=3042517 RepID=A0AAW6T8H8_9MICO|nr:CoA ester lyase [Klugiella sp. YN-L-19]MDI2098614.1 CoA ester lyase [Klugiella sp. YN-L-19]